MKRLMDEILNQNTQAIVPNMLEWPPKRKHKKHSTRINGFLASRKQGPKGTGLFASRNIEKGRILLIEELFEQRAQMVMPRTYDRESEGTDERKQELENKLDLIFSKRATKTYRQLLVEQEGMEKALSARKVLTQRCIDKVKALAPEKTFFTKMCQWNPNLMEETSSDVARSKRPSVIAFANKNRMDPIKAATLLRAISRTAFSIEVGPLLVNTALALFPAGSMINHACVPNAARAFVQDRMIIYALDDIGQGQEVTINYSGFILAIQEDSGFFENREDVICHAQRFLCLCDLCVRQRQAISNNPRLKRLKDGPSIVNAYHDVSNKIHHRMNDLSEWAKAKAMAGFVFRKGTQIQENASLNAVLKKSPILRMALIQWMLLTIEAFLEKKTPVEKNEMAREFIKRLPCLIEAFLPGNASAQNKTAHASRFKGQNIDNVCRLLGAGFSICSMVYQEELSNELQDIYDSHLTMLCNLAPMQSCLYKLFVAQGTFLGSLRIRFDRK